MENALEIVDKINNFYTQSFNQLITLTLAILAFIGVLVPILITLYQARQLKNDKNELVNLVQDKHVQVKSEVSKEIQSFFQTEREKLQNELAALKDEIRKSEAKAQGGLRHLQGNTSLKNGQYMSALDDYLVAAIYNITASDELNLQRVLRLALEECLPKLDCRILETHFAMKDTFERAITKLKEISTNGRYDDIIRKLTLEFENACNRKASGKTA